MEFHLLFVGSPLLDVLSTCDRNYLQKYDLEPDDCVLAKDIHQSLLSEVLQKTSAVFRAGGSAQNTARVCKWVLGTKGKVSFAGCVGIDDVAEKMKAQLLKDDVCPLYSENSSLPSGICACLVASAGERSMVTDLGAGATYNVSYLQSSIVSQVMKESNIIFVEGYLISHSPDVVKAIAVFCHNENVSFALSLSAIYVCEVYSQFILDYMPFVDFLFGNYEEAKYFLEKVTPGVEISNPQQCAAMIARMSKENNKSQRTVVITDGPNPIGVCVGNQNPQEFIVPKVENFIEATGCGDALAGAFLATYLCTNSVSESVKSGIKAATKMTQTRGCAIPEEKSLS